VRNRALILPHRSRDHFNRWGSGECFVSFVERLERRAYLAVPASFVPSGILTVNGDSLDNRILISRNFAGAILVNNGTVPISGGTPTVANTTLIQVAALAGNDEVTLDEANGAAPRRPGRLVGNDTLTGGSGNDTLVG
jgi:Ca2+-binding RTX toxin-like protein